MEPLPVFDPVPLIRDVHDQLLTLLRGLRPEDWLLPTVAVRWRVKDIAAHLLDTQVRRVSFQRDHWTPPPPADLIEKPADLVEFLNRLNGAWVEAAFRLSPGVLLDLLAWSGAALDGTLRPLDLEATALFPVAWAGEAASTLRFDLARDLTEFWLHQQQIRLATGRPPLFEPHLLHPVLDTFMRAVPHAYRGVEARDGVCVGVELTGEAPRSYALLRDGGAWKLGLPGLETPEARISLDPATAWLLFSKGLAREEALARVTLRGDLRLAQPFLGVVAVMA